MRALFPVRDIPRGLNMTGKAKKIKKKSLGKSNKEPISIHLNEPSIEANVL
jgi:hypothetical protein